MKNNDGVNLGDLVKDTITGFEGVVIGETRWLYGCRRFTVQPRDLKDGKPIEPVSFDEPQLLVLEAFDGGWLPRSNAGSPAAAAETGGPRPEPTRRPDPVR